MIRYKDIKNNKGITMMVLVITITVLIIISGIALSTGTNMIQKAKAENIATNMITMRAKIKIYVEETKSKTWNLTDKITERNNILTTYNKLTSINLDNDTEVKSRISNSSECSGFNITKDAISEMNLEGIYGYNDIGTNGIRYVAVIDNNDWSKIEIVYTKGIEYQGKKYYTLSSLQENL